MHDTDRRETQLGPVLVCAGTDPELAGGLARQAGEILAGRRAVVLAVARSGTWADAWRRANEAAHAASSPLEASGWDVSRRVIDRDDVHPWEVAIALADSEDASVIVAGATERPGHAHGSLGREARALAHRTRRPLLVVPRGNLAADDAPVLFACDGSESATGAIATAAHLLRARPAVVGTVWESILVAAPAAVLAIPAGVAAEGAAHLDGETRARAEATAADGAAQLEAAGWDASAETIETRSGVWQALVETACAADAAVVVTGSRGRSRVAAALLGSVAEGVLRHAGRPVLVVPGRPAR